ncbi:LD-carboxypeptidase [Ideonella sp. A 288]|uniref:LD-carboxypeptidase n=1 Tax=Ideonella sp. A 288 TaxID=1962181 RepID=UPI000B4B5D25|nr:LD-carboxypeptidase [Ideonella sp. A 288]
MTLLHILSPAGVELRSAAVTLARKRLGAMGFAVTLDPSVRARHQRFAGTDDQRLEALHRVADAAPSVAMASRGGYGMTRLLDRIDWPRLARSVERGTRWVGFSDLTALQLGMLAHTGAESWMGPMACDDFGRSDEQGGVDEITRDCFVEAMGGELEAVGFRTEAGFDGLEARGRLWGGNLAMVQSLIGTPHWPRVKGGILVLEEVNEHPYRVERALLQLHQAGVLSAQKAVVLGAVSDWRASPLDRGYTLKTAIAHVRSVCDTPILTGLPFGHVPTKVSLPIGRRVQLVVAGRDVLIGW